MKQLRLIILLFAISQQASGQIEKELIVKQFDVVFYYPDSTIKSAFRLERGNFNGHALFFDSTGNPKIIAEFKNGKPGGIWGKADGGFIDFNENPQQEHYPGCGTGVILAVETFEYTYRMLLAGKRSLFEFFKSK